MASKLSALLVQDRVVGFRQMDAAVQRQAQLGGRIGTALLELGYVDESVLLYYMSKLRQVPALDPALLTEIDLDAISVFSEERARALLAIPLQLDRRRLLVGVCDPLPPERVEAFETQTSLKVDQVLMLEVRFWQALRTFYGADIPERYAALIAQFPVAMGTRDGALMTSGAHLAVADPGRPPTAEHLVVPPVFDLSAEEIPGLTWTVQELTAFFHVSASRDHMLLAALGFLGKFFTRRGLFVVGSQRLRGFALQFPGTPSRPIERAEVPLSAESRLGRLVSGDAYYVGGLAESGLAPMYEQLGLAAPADICAVPVKVGPRAALLLVGDRAAEPIEAPTLPIVFLIANRLSAGLERLILKQKLRRTAQTASVEIDVDALAAHRRAPGAEAGPHDGAPIEVTPPATSETPAVAPDALHDEPDTPEALAGAAQAPEFESASTDVFIPVERSFSAPHPLLAEEGPPLAGVARPSPAAASAPSLSGSTPAPSLSGSGATRSLSGRGAAVEPVEFRFTDAPVSVGHAPPPERPAPAQAVPESRPRVRHQIDTSSFHETPGSLGFVPVPRVTGELAIVSFRRREEDSGPQPAVDMALGGPHAIDLDLRLPGVLLPPRVREPRNDDERAFSARLDAASNAELITWLEAEEEVLADAAFVALLDRGSTAHDELLVRFPGPLHVDRHQTEAVTDPKPLERHGPIVWLVALQLRSLAPRLHAVTASEEPDARYYAVKLLTQAGDGTAVIPIAERLFDRDDQVRETALVFLERHLQASGHARTVLGAARRRLGARDAWTAEHAIAAVHRLRDVEAVPGLIGLLDHASDRVRQRASQALSRLTFQDFGADRALWERWASKRGTGSRSDWLLEAMIHKEWKVRDNAARELRTIPRLIVNYHPNLDRRQLDVARRAVHRHLFGRDGGGE